MSLSYEKYSGFKWHPSSITVASESNGIGDKCMIRTKIIVFDLISLRKLQSIQY